MYAQAHKRLVRVTLDIECYDDLELENIDWRDILTLEGDENVDISIKDYSELFQCDSSQIGMCSQLEDLIDSQ